MMAKVLQLNDGLKLFKDEVLKDDLMHKRIDIAVVTFGEDVEVIHNFSSIDKFEPPSLLANGSTPMGHAIIKAINLVEKRKTEYRTEGIDYYKLRILLITDGEPTDMQPGDSTWNYIVNKLKTEMIMRSSSFLLWVSNLQIWTF